jgi:hypothetical protein
MLKLNSKDLRNLEIGQKVLLIRKNTSRLLTFAGKNPDNENYLIFCHGEYIEQVYTSDNKELSDIWLLEYTSKDVSEIITKSLEDEIKAVKSIYGV